jgi:hypothetical protein
MFKVTRSVWKLIVAVIVVFVIVAAIGVFIALDTASNPSNVNADTVSGASAVPADKPAAPSGTGALSPLPSSAVDEAIAEEVDEGAVDDGSIQPQASGQTPSSTPQGFSGSSGSPSGAAPNTGNGGSNTNPGDTSSPVVAPPPKVWHEPVYRTVHHDAVYQSVHHDAEYTTHTQYYSVCSNCGFKVQGSIYPHQDATGHTGFASDVPVSEQVLVRAAYDEQVLVQAAYDEQVLVTEGYWS